MTRSPLDGFAHPNTVAGPAVIISSPGGLTCACQSQTNTNATNGINFLIFLVKDPSQQPRAESVICSGLFAKLHRNVMKCQYSLWRRPFSALNGFEIGHFAVERLFASRVNARLRSIDRVFPLSDRSNRGQMRRAAGRETKRAPTVGDCGALVVSPLARRALWGENRTEGRLFSREHRCGDLGFAPTQSLPSCSKQKVPKAFHSPATGSRLAR